MTPSGMADSEKEGGRMKIRATDQFDWVRLFYSVPALRGVRVTYEGKEGTITGASYGIEVHIDDTPKNRVDAFHPNDLTYVPTERQLATCVRKRQEYWAMAYPELHYPKAFTFKRTVEAVA